MHRVAPRATFGQIMLEAALAFAALDRRGNLWVLVEIKEFVDHDAKCKDRLEATTCQGTRK